MSEVSSWGSQSESCAGQHEGTLNWSPFYNVRSSSSSSKSGDDRECEAYRLNTNTEHSLRLYVHVHYLSCWKKRALPSGWRGKDCCWSGKASEKQEGARELDPALHLAGIPKMEDNGLTCLPSCHPSAALERQTTKGFLALGRVQPKGFRPKPKEGVTKLSISAESRKELKGNRKIWKKLKEGISVLSAEIGLKMLQK